MTKYEKELSELRPRDTVNNSEEYALHTPFTFISTAGHGYLCVPRGDMYFKKACTFASNFSYVGKNAVYLEEDCDATSFSVWLEEMKARTPTIG